MPPREVKLLEGWLDGSQPYDEHPDLWIFVERDGTRGAAVKQVQEAIKDHLVGLEIIRRMGNFPRTEKVIRNSLPTSKKIRSGDLGELLATEYVREKTPFTVPIKRLRYKDDANTSMRGDDLFAYRVISAQQIGVLKGESKSRAQIAEGVVKEACSTLDREHGRPKPSTLAFVSKRLRQEGRHAEAELVERLQSGEIGVQSVVHLVFTFSGNDPRQMLRTYAKGKQSRKLVGVIVKDHQEFIALVFAGVSRGRA